MFIEQLFLEFANHDTECQPKFIVQTGSSADKGRWCILFYFRLIEEEKENTEQRAEETESREGRGSLGSLRRFKSVSSLNLLSTSSHADSCPPKPKLRRRQHSLAQEGDQLGIMTLVCVCLLPAASLPQHAVFCLFFVFSLYTQKKIRYICYAQRSKSF